MKIAEVGNVDFSMRQFLLPLLRGARERGHEVVGICGEGPLLAQVRAEGFRIVAVPMARSWSPVAQVRSFAALVSAIRRERPDVVHAHFPISGLLARLAARIAGVPRIAYTCHGFLFNQPGPWPRRAMSLVLEWLAGRITDVFVVVSAKETRDAQRLGIHRAPVCVQNGRDPDRFFPDPALRQRLRTAMGVPEGRVVIVIVSRIVVPKGYRELLAAMREVAEAELWVVGERLASDRGADLAADFAASGLGERLRLLGYREDTADLLRAADIFVLPSWFEAMPMSVIEAMLTGLPVVASDIPGPREQVIDGRTGLLVPARDPTALAAALRRLCEDEAWRSVLGAAGRAVALERFDERQTVARTLDLLEA